VKTPSKISLAFDNSSEQRPLLIAGPCSAETEEQVLATARGLAATGRADIFRCGIWKPRTRPGDFEGVGEDGLGWLQRVREETGLPVMVEVAMPSHVEKCLAAGIDRLWIGSRTIVNPFSVGELALALKGTGAELFIKNPVSPDLRLWIGAIERMKKQGISKLRAVHRGFVVPNPGPYRNAPLWHLPLELRKTFPDLPIIGDPSHICGGRELLTAVSQHALDLDFDGLMIESHIRPANALTDSEQQITPGEFNDLVNNLDFSASASKLQPLDILREEIDRLDDELIAVLAARMKVSGEIGEVKKQFDMRILDADRWEQVIRDRLLKADLSGLDRDFLKAVMEEIHKHSQRRQK
jgi:chorismate mutase